METATLERRLAQLQSEIRKIQNEIQSSHLKEEDRLQNRKWRESGLIPEGWCAHKVVFGRRVFYVICDVADYYEQQSEIRYRFYTPDIHGEVGGGVGKAEQYIKDILQSVQRLRTERK